MKPSHTRHLWYFVMIFLSLGACSSPKWQPTDVESLPYSDRITLTLAASDSLFSYAAIMHYREHLPPFVEPERLNLDSAGPLLYLTVQNLGSGVRLPIRPEYYGMLPLAIRQPAPAIGLVVSIDGVQLDYTDYPSGIGVSVVPYLDTCGFYGDLLRYVPSQSSMPFESAIDFLDVFPMWSYIRPGEYEVRVLMQSSCTRDDDGSSWSGRVLSNPVYFRLAEDLSSPSAD